MLSRGIILLECDECKFRIGQRCMRKGPELHEENLSEYQQIVTEVSPLCGIFHI